MQAVAVKSPLPSLSDAVEDVPKSTVILTVESEVSDESLNQARKNDILANNSENLAKADVFTSISSDSQVVSTDCAAMTFACVSNLTIPATMGSLCTTESAGSFSPGNVSTPHSSIVSPIHSILSHTGANVNVPPTPDSSSTSATSTPRSSTSRGASIRLKSASLRGTLSRSQGGKLAEAFATAKQSGQVDDHGFPLLDLTQFEGNGLDDVSNNSARSRMMSKRSRDSLSIRSRSRPALTTSMFDSPTHSESATSPANSASLTERALKSGANAGRMVCVDVFNSIWAMNAPTVIDIRTTEDFQKGHIPRAINIPVTADDLALAVSLKDLEERVELKDRRNYTSRLMRQICICGYNTSAEVTTSSLAVELMDTISQTWMSASAAASAVSSYGREVDQCVLYIAGLLLEEKAATTVDILSGGADSYLEHYPHVVCKFSEEEKAGTTPHTHIKSFPAFPSEILDHAIYLGTEIDSSKIEQLEKLGITHILNISRENPNHFEDQIQYCKIDIDDEAIAPITTHFETAFSYLDKALEDTEKSNRILVHCQMGVSRSASVVIAYVMRMYGCSLQQAIAMVRSRRPQVLPNRGFLKQLSDYEKELRPEQPSTYDDCVKVLYPGD